MNNEFDKKTDLNVCGNTTNTCTSVIDDSPTSAGATTTTTATTTTPVAAATTTATKTTTTKSRNLSQPSTSSLSSSLLSKKKNNAIGMTKKSCKNSVGAGSGTSAAAINSSNNNNQNNKNFNKNNLKNQKNSDSCVNNTTISATTTTTCSTAGNIASNCGGVSGSVGSGSDVGGGGVGSSSSTGIYINIHRSGGANANGKNVSKLATTSSITTPHLNTMAAVAPGNDSCASSSSPSTSMTSTSATPAPLSSKTNNNNLASSKKPSMAAWQQHHHQQQQQPELVQHQQQQQPPPPPLPRQQHQQTSTDICGGCVSIGVGGDPSADDAENAAVSAPNTGSHPVAGDCNIQTESPTTAVLTQTTTAAGLNQPNSACSTSSSISSNSSLSSSSVGIVNAISTALQNIITSDNSDTDTEVFPPPRVTDLSESDEDSVSEILLACLCLRPDLLDDIPESDPESCGNDGEGNDDEDDGDDEDEDEDDELQDPNEVGGNFLLETATDPRGNLTALFEAAAQEKAPVLRHATHAIDETKQVLTKMRCASSPRDKTIFSRTLIAACNDNDVNTVRRLLGKGNININESTDDGESLLSMACSAGYYELAQVLLAMSAAQVEDKGQKDCTPLMEAASAGHLDIVKLLISHNAEVNAHCATGNTPLMFACAGGHCDVVKELLIHGANVEEQNENGHTPLMEAASAGHVEIAKVLLEHGAGINTHSNEFKESALTLACYKGHLNMVRFLLQAGADQEHKTDEMHTALMEASMDGHVEVARLLLDSGAQVNMPTDSFESPLTLAACGGHVELATLLIERGANIEEVNDEGYTPLMEAAREGHEEMVALLLKKGANINATTEETQETALTLACCGGFMEVAEFLIKEGASLELGASTPLMEAAQEGHTDLVRFLLQNKANVHAETQTGDTALTHAAENGHTDAAEVLLGYGAELEHESEGGRTPLMKACRAGHLCTVKFLIQKGADVNKQTTSNDHTPLSLACAGGHQAVVELLLKSGADPYHKLKDNSTMLIEAAKGGHTRVVELLFKYPLLIQNHQNELQTNGINNAANTAGQLQLINIQQQKQLQQLQHQLQQRSAPPGLHEVPEAVRVSNQQLFHQQQFPSVDYLDEPFIANSTDGFAIDPNSLNAQQQEALIAKSRLFHCFEQGFAHGVRSQSGIVNQLISSNNTPSTTTVNQTHASSSSGNNATAVATPTTTSNTNTIKQKSLLRKNRQPPAPFELNLTNSEAQQVRSQPLGEDESSAGMIGSVACTSTGTTSSSNNEEKQRRRQNIIREYHKNMQMVRDNKAPPSLLPSFDVGVGPLPAGSAVKDETPNMPLLLASALQTGANMPVSQEETTAMADLFKPGTLNSLAPYSNSLMPPNLGISTSIGTQTVSNNTATTTTTQITTPSEVSQSTAISDRPKVKPVSKKDGKNLRKTVFPALPILQQNQMVSIYNNLPLLLTSESNKIDRNQQAFMRGVVMAAQIEQSKFNNTPMPGTPSTSTGGETGPIGQSLQHNLIGSQTLHEALQAACSQAASSIVQSDSRYSRDIPPNMPSGSCESINSIGSSSAADPEEYNMGVSAQFKMLQMVAAHMPNYPMTKTIQRLFVDQPKSPTESPPASSAFNQECIGIGGNETSADVINAGGGDTTSNSSIGNNTATKRSATVEEYEEDEDEEIDDDDDEEDDEDDEDDDEGDEDDDDDDEENEDEENEEDEDEGDDDEEDIELDSPTKSRKLSHPLGNLILSNVALKQDDLTQALCDFQVFQGNFKPGTLTNLQQQFNTQQATFAQNEEHFRMYDNTDDDCEMYAPLGETLEQFSAEDDGTRDRIYDITVDEIFQVIHDPSLQELTTNLNCSELADIGLNSICKTRWNGHTQHLQSTSAANMCLSPEEQNEQHRQTNQLLLDYQLQQQIQQVEDLQICNQLQNQLQQTTLSLIPISPDDQQQASNIGIQTLPNNQVELQQLQHQQQQTGVSQTISQSLLQAAGQQQILQQQQQQQQQILSGDAQQQANYVFNVDPEKPSQSLQLLFQLPSVQQQGQMQKQQQHQQQLQSAASLLSAQQQQLQQQQQHHHLHQQQQQQQQQQCNSVQEIGPAGVICQPVVQTNQVTQTNLILQQQAALAQQVLNQQVLKQKQQQQQQILNFHQQQQQQSCSQHTQQVQVATQTQPAVNRNASTSQFCPSIPISADVSIGVCTITSQQQQQQSQQQQQQQIQQQQQQQQPLTTTKSSGGIAKKAIDKASRKDRHRYSLLRQTPAGSQANTTTQQYQQSVTTVSTTPDKIIDVDSETDSNHDTALTLACAGGHEELVELLINRGANIEHRDKKGFTPLILAATAGHEKVVDILLKHNAELEAQSERTKDTPLSLACSGGRYEVVELLLSVNANKEHRNVSDYTPLSLAASGGYVNIIKLLLSNGAEINSRTGSKLGISPLMLAAMNGHTAAVKLLLDQGSDINAQIETNRNTALTLACFQGRHEVVSLLLDRKANVEHRAKTGLTPLMEAASGGYIEVGRVLLDKGADVNAAPVPTSRDTALTIAADKGHLKFVELLLSRNASVEVKNKKGNSPLWLAAHGGHLSVVEILYNHSADIDSQDNRRVSCLMAAFRKGHTKVVKWMVQYVTQFPSDQEMNRFISTISDKELLEKCYDCVNIIRAAKEAQAVKANKNASILLEELDMERTREESRRAAAARRRERKKKKKMEKKEEKRRLLEGSNENENTGDGCDKDSEKDDDSDKEDQAVDEEDDIVHHNPYREEGDSGIDQGSCSSTDVKTANLQADKGNKNKNKKKKNNPSSSNIRNSNSPTLNVAANIGSQNGEEPATLKKDKKKVVDEVVASTSSKNKKVELPTAAKVAEYKSKVNPQQQQIIVDNPEKEKPTCHKREDSKRKEAKESLKQREKEKENLAPKEETVTSQQAPVRKHSEKKITTDAGVPSNTTASTSTACGTVQKQQLNPPEGSGRKSMVFSSRHINANLEKDDSSHNSKLHRGGGSQQHDEQHSSSKVSPLKPQTGSAGGSGPVAAKRGEDGWKEVVRKSSTQQQTSSNSSSTSSSAAPEMTCKKVQVPVNAISRVIGRAGSNINAIRATTGAHIEVEKQGKNQSERSITIKGLADATKQAHMLISALIKDPDVDILQMLPRINPNIKPVPLVVNSWDKNTPLTQSSSSSTFSSSTSVTTTASSSYTKSGTSTTKVTASSSISNNSTSKSSASVSSQQSTAKSSSSSSTSACSSRSQPSGVSSKGFFFQQNPRGSTVSSSNSTSTQKSRNVTTSDSLSSATKTTTTYTNVIMSQRNAVSKNQFTPQAQPQPFVTAAAAATSGQTFAAKLTSTTGHNINSVEKRPAGGNQQHAVSVQNQMSSSFHGSPKKNTNKSSSSSNNSNSMNNLNTLAGPIGTFNMADVTLSMAVAAAAASQAAQQAVPQSQGRSITPIGQPPITTGQQSLTSNRNVSPLPVVISVQSNAPVSTTISSMTAPALATGSSVAIKAPAIVPPLQSKIGSEYSLFNDTYQNQWESKPMYNPTNSDTIPKADASKAPGYNRGNVISSPVSSKASSSNSTSPPSNPAIIQPPNLNILPVSVTATSPGSSGNSISGVAGGQQQQQQQPQSLSIGSSMPSSTPATSINVGSDGDLPSVLKPVVGNNQNLGGSALQPATVPPPSGLAIQRPTGGQHRTATSQIDTPTLNFGPIGSNSGRSVPGAVGDHVQNSSANRYYEQIAQSNLSHPINFNVDSLLPAYHLGSGNGGNGTSAPSMGPAGGGPMSNSSSNPLHMSRLNPRASSFLQQNKTNQQLGGASMFHQNNGMVIGGAFTSGGQKPLGGLSAAPGRPQSQPQTGSGARWYPTNEYSGGYAMQSTARELLNLENGLSSAMGGVTSGSPAAMSPNNPNVQPSQANGLMPQQLNQQQQQQNMPGNSGNGGVGQEDIRKMPRPIGTERAASWKYNNYPNMNSANLNSGVPLDTDPGSTAAGGNPPTIGGPIPPWIMEKTQNQQQPPSALNHPQNNWMKSQYRYYGVGAEYHQQDQFHIMDYHTTVPPPSVNQAQPMNLVPTFQYPHYVGHSEINQMPEKIELWDHHDKNTWPSNWTN